MCLFVSVCTMCLLGPEKPEEGTRSQGTRVTGILGCLMWGLEIKPEFSVRAEDALNC